MQILNWENKTGVHCGSVAIQNVINYYGVNYPEEMCFGFQIFSNPLPTLGLFDLRVDGFLVI